MIKVFLRERGRQESRKEQGRYNDRSKGERKCVCVCVCVCVCKLHSLYRFKIRKTLPSSTVIIYDKAGVAEHVETKQQECKC